MRSGWPRHGLHAAAMGEGRASLIAREERAGESGTARARPDGFRTGGANVTNGWPWGGGPGAGPAPHHHQCGRVHDVLSFLLSSSLRPKRGCSLCDCFRGRAVVCGMTSMARGRGAAQVGKPWLRATAHVKRAVLRCWGWVYCGAARGTAGLTARGAAPQQQQQRSAAAARTASTQPCNAFSQCSKGSLPPALPLFSPPSTCTGRAGCRLVAARPHSAELLAPQSPLRSHTTSPFGPVLALVVVCSTLTQPWGGSRLRRKRGIGIPGTAWPQANRGGEGLLLLRPVARRGIKRLKTLAGVTACG